MQPIFPGIALHSNDPVNSLAYVTGALQQALILNKADNPGGVAVFHGGLASRVMEPGRTVFLTYWETTEIPPLYVNHLNTYKAVGVCNDRELDLFRRQLSVPVFKFPHGTDSRACHRSREPRFTFMAVGETHGLPARKRIAEIVAHFTRAFPIERDVQLIVKQSQNCPEIYNFDSRVTIIRDRLNRQDMLRLMQRADVGVFLGAVESWGHPQMEMMAMGKPIITSKWGGLCEFFDSSCGIELPYTLVDAPTLNAYYTHGQIPRSDEDAFERAMRDMFYNPSLVATMGAAAQRKVARFTWNASVKVLINELSKSFA